MTQADLLTSIKSRALVPISQATFSDDDLLRFTDEALQTRIAPFYLRYTGKRATTLNELPTELHPMLAQAVVCQLLESLGFLDKASAAEQRLERMESAVVPLISPGTNDKPKRVINRHPLVWFS